MDVWKALEKRRTVRAFKKGVPEDLLRKIILAGSWAPSGRNSQPWEFIIVNDPNTIDKIAEQKRLNWIAREMSEEFTRRQLRAFQNSTVVVVCNKKGGLANVAAYMAAQNMALALTAEGMGCVMSTIGGEYGKAVEKLLGLPQEYELAMVLLMGVPESIPQKSGQWDACAENREEFSWLHINRFGNRQ